MFTLFKIKLNAALAILSNYINTSIVGALRLFNINMEISTQICHLMNVSPVYAEITEKSTHGTLTTIRAQSLESELSFFYSVTCNSLNVIVHLNHFDYMEEYIDYFIHNFSIYIFNYKQLVI